MDTPTHRIGPTKAEMVELELCRLRRSFLARLTQPLRSVRMSRLMLAKMGAQEERRSPFGKGPI